MSSNPLPDAYITSAAEERKTLAQALKENEELRSDNEKLRETAQRMNARMATLMEGNEQLRKERDSYNEQLQEAKDQHETELRELTEEMAAAARFSEKEWREHCDRVEAQCARLQKALDACVSTTLEYLPHAEPVVRQKLQVVEEEQRRGIEGRKWKASLKTARVREAASAEGVFASRGLPVSELRRTHLGKGPATDNSNSYAAGEGLYNLFLALRPGGPVDRFAMRELLKGEGNVIQLFYNAQGGEDTWRSERSKGFPIPAADAYELAACVLCHLPALQVLSFRNLPPLSTRSLEWASHVPQCMQRLYLWSTDYTVADLRELHRHRGGRSFRVDVNCSRCTDWGEFAGVGYGSTKRTRVNEELGGMVNWW